MLNSICIVCVLMLSSIPMTIFIKICRRNLSIAIGYLSATIVHLLMFSMCVFNMADIMSGATMFPIKVMLGLVCAEIVLLIVVSGYLFLVKHQKMPRLRVHGSKREWLLWLLAIVVFAVAAAKNLSSVTDEAITMMADINRVDLFGVINSNPITMLAYYIKALGGISQADAVCIVVPLFFYIPVICALWEVASALFAEDVMKQNLCFLSEAILVLFGNCMYSMTGMIGSGLINMTHILLATVLPLMFAVCFRIYNADKKEAIPCMAVSVLILISLYILDATAFVLAAMTAFIFALLMIGRRYVSWLKFSN